MTRALPLLVAALLPLLGGCLATLYGYGEPASEKFGLLQGPERAQLAGVEAPRVPPGQHFSAVWARDGLDLTRYTRFDASIAFNDDAASGAGRKAGQPGTLTAADYLNGSRGALQSLVEQHLAARGMTVLKDQAFVAEQQALLETLQSGPVPEGLRTYAGVAAVLSTWSGPEDHNRWELVLIVFDRAEATERALKEQDTRVTRESLLENLAQSTIWRVVVRKPAARPVNPAQDYPLLAPGELEALMDSAFAHFMRRP